MEAGKESSCKGLSVSAAQPARFSAFRTHTWMMLLALVCLETTPDAFRNSASCLVVGMMPLGSPACTSSSWREKRSRGRRRSHLPSLTARDAHLLSCSLESVERAAQAARRRSGKAACKLSS